MGFEAFQAIVNRLRPTVGDSTPETSYVAAAPASITIEDLKRAVREDHRNRDHAVRLSTALLKEGSVEQMFNFWRDWAYPSNSVAAEQLIVAGEQLMPSILTKSDLFRLRQDLRWLSFQRPSSSIPKEYYLAFKRHSLFADGDDFLVEHIEKFSVKSSLLPFVEEQGVVLEDWAAMIWRRVFADIEDISEALILARYLRVGCVRRGQIKWFMNMWEKFSDYMGQRRAYHHEFVNLQLAWCFLETGEDNRFKDTLREWISLAFLPLTGNDVEEMAQRLASRCNFTLLAEFYRAGYGRYRQKVLRGAIDGFKGSGDVTGLTRVAMLLTSFDRESMMGDVLSC